MNDNFKLPNLKKGSCLNCLSNNTYHRKTLEPDMKCKKCGYEWSSDIEQMDIGDIFDPLGIEYPIFDVWHVCDLIVTICSVS